MLSSRSATISFHMMIRVDDYVVMDGIYISPSENIRRKKGKGRDEWILHSTRSTFCLCVAD